MSLKAIQKATARAEALAGQPGHEAAEREAWGEILKGVARHLRKGSFKHGAESLRLLKRGAPWFSAGKSQLFQDVWALYELGYKTGGFFVEFGAASGVDLSNSWLLEKQFGWSGILAEPNPQFREALLANRGCTLSFDCVWSRSGETIPFRCAEVGEHSGVHAEHGELIQVPTISLNDLLERHAAPTVIDFMSVDIEGAELEVLSAFDFDRWDVRLIAVEHNSREDRAALQALLASHGYERRFPELSHYDDWYRRA